MLSTNLYYIFSYLIWLIVVQELIVSRLTKYLNDKIFALSDNLESIKINNKITEMNNLKKVQHNLGYITKIISYFEAIFITTLSFVYFSYYSSDFEAIAPILSIVAGWMAIKIFGSYSQWSDYATGRAFYYVFLIGSFSNIIIAILSGYLLIR